MNISNAIMGFQQNQNMSQIGTALLSKQLDTVEDMGQSMIAMMNAAPSPSLESMVNPAVGQHIDLTV